MEGNVINVEEAMHVESTGVYASTTLELNETTMTSQEVVSGIMSELFSSVCDQIASLSHAQNNPKDKVEEKLISNDKVEKIDVDEMNDDNVTSKEVVHEIIYDLFYSVCETIENNLNEKYTKESAKELSNSDGMEISQEAEMKTVISTSNVNAITLVKNCSLVPYDESSESGSEDSQSDSASSTDESDSSDETDSSDESDDKETTFKTRQPKIPTFKPIKTRGELDLEDLPKIEHLQISAEGSKLEVIGHVHGIVNTLVVIHTRYGTPTLDIDSYVFAEDGSPMGQIFDVFGNTQNPYYSIRFNNSEEIEEKCIKIGDKVYYAPEKINLYSTVFAEEIKKCSKGSDASWEHNNEPPEQYLDYSDDESERTAKRKSKSKRTFNASQDVINKRQRWQQPYTPRTPGEYPVLRHPTFRPYFPPTVPNPSTSTFQLPRFQYFQNSYSNSFGSEQYRLPPPNFNFPLNTPYFPSPPPTTPSSHAPFKPT